MFKNMLLVLLLFAACASSVLAQPVIQGVVNAASYGPNMSPGCWVAIFGQKLAPQLAQAQSVPLATNLAGVTVRIGGVAAPLLFVSAGQINALIPFEVTGSTAAVVVTTSEGASSPYNVRVFPRSPALFTLANSGSGSPLMFDAVTWRLLDTMDTRNAVVLLATGMGQTTPPASSSSGGSATPPFNEVNLSELKAYMGEAEANVLWAGLMPGYPGIYQLNVKAAGAASTRVFLRQGGAQSNVTDVNVPAGSNVANITGSIDALIPFGYSTHQMNPISFSLGFQGAAFSTAFDILPGAGPFVVSAVSESGSANISFAPQAGTYEASLTVPTAPAKSGDFSAAGATLYDLLTMSGATCVPLSGNMIPMSRMDPIVMSAMRSLPLPNTAGVAGFGTGFLKASGSATAGTRFVIDASTNAGLAMFGGYLQVPCGNPFASRTDTLKLFVDGKLIASKDVSYALGHR